MDKPFTTDGCSGGMTWAFRLVFRRDPPWQGACIEHDRAYWAGGTRLDRSKADAWLQVRVDGAGYPWVSLLMWLAVRIGGHPLLPLPWRWGYGWRWPTGYEHPERSDV